MKKVQHYLIGLTIGILLSVYPLSGETIVVDQGGNGDYYTIQDAYSASSSGDTIFLNAGVYLDYNIFINHMIYIVGVDRNSVTWTQNNYPLFENDASVYVSEVTILDNRIRATSDITFKHCVLNNAYVQTYNSNHTITFQNTLIKDSDYYVNHTGSSGYKPDISFYNSMLYNIGPNPPFYADVFTVKNSIVVNCSSIIPTSNTSVNVTYTCLYQSQTISGYGNITYDPLLVNYSGGDYRLQATSPCIDTGDVIALWNDPDGSRNDMGLYGGSYSWGILGPLVTNMTVSPSSIQSGGTITIQATAIVD